MMRETANQPNVIRLSRRQPDNTYDVIALDVDLALNPVWMHGMLLLVAQRVDVATVTSLPVRSFNMTTQHELGFRMLQGGQNTGKIVVRISAAAPDGGVHVITGGTGGLGILTGLTQPTPEALYDEIKRCQSMTSKPFGVNLTILPSLIPADYDAYAAVIAEERVTMVEVAGGSPKKYMKMWHDAGVKVLHKSATIRHALKAQSVGVDLVEVVGYEGSIAGGQPGDEVGAWVMLAKATALLDIPVIAAGASGTGRQLAAALAMGAHGITMATRFLATVEAPIHPRIKEALASPDTDERSTTIVMRELNNATRVFKNDVSLKINEILAEPEKDFSLIKDYATGLRTKDMWQVNGSWDDAMWSCGQSVGLIDDVPTCRVLCDRIVREAEAQLAVGASRVVGKSRL